MSLTVLPIEGQIVIAGHLVMTSERPMDKLHSLWLTCLSMRRIYDDPAIDSRLALDRFRHRKTWDDPVDYEALPARLTQGGNPEACFFTGI